MGNYRWTCRNISPTAIQLLAEVSETSGLSYGDLLTEAIETWYEGLPEEPEESDDPIDLTT